MAAFRQVVTKLQESQREEALIGLEFVVRLDPTFAPALNLQQQLASGAAEIDLTEVISQLQAPTTATINSLLVEAVEDFNNRAFESANQKVEQVLLDLPGHQEARQLSGQIQEALKVETQVGQFLTQSREALERGDSQEAANFVMMAQALDPHHNGIGEALAAIERGGGSLQAPVENGASSASPPVSFEAIDESPLDFTTSADGGALFGEDRPDVAAASTIALEERAPEDAASTDASGGDVSDLFQADPVAADQGPPVPVTEAIDTESSLRDLLAQGDAAAAAGNHAAAIDAWSKIFLADHSHEEAARRIEQSRHANDEIGRRLDRMLVDARDAHLGGDVGKAAGLIDEILSLSPNHVETTILKELLDSGQSPAPEPVAVAAAPVSDMPDLEEDLFREEVPEPSESKAPAVSPSEFLDSAAAYPTSEPAVARRSWPSWLVAVIVAGGLLVILLGFWVGGKMFSSDETGDQATLANELLAEAQNLFEQHKIQEAIHLLEEFPADDVNQQARIDRRLEKYREAAAPPTPTPIPATFTKAEQLLAQGRWMEAFVQVMAGLNRHPRDGGLNDLRDLILGMEPQAAGLYSAMSSRNYPAAVSIGRDLLETYTDQQDLSDIYDRSLFDAALAELRAYNLTGADTYLSELALRQPEDEEVQRVLAFIESYKARPVDLKLKVFIRNIPQR